MSEQVNVDGLILKTRQYEFADGLRDIQYGILLSSIGFITWLGVEPAWLAWVFGLAQNYGRYAVWAAFVFVWLIPIAAAFGTLRLIGFARRRWLWRESGMVKPARQVVSRWSLLLAALALIAGLAAGFLMPPLGVVDEWYPARVLYASIGWGSGVFFIAFSRDIRLPRYLWIGLLGGVASTLLLLFPLQFGQAGLAFGLGWGALLVIVGAFEMWRSRPQTRNAGSHA